MQLRMVARRSLNGSMTIVGDIAQATGAWAHADWEEILERLPTERRDPRRAELTIGYRIPAPNMALAARVLELAAPELQPPTSVREDGDPPRVLRAAGRDVLARAAAAAVASERDAVGLGNVAVICPSSLRRTARRRPRGGRDRVRHRPPLRPRPPGHRRPGRAGQGPRGRRLGRRRAGRDRRRGGPGLPGAVCRPHPFDEAARHRARRPAARGVVLNFGS